MKGTRLAIATGLYLAFWAAIAGAVIYFSMAAGLSAWLAVPLAILLFSLVNGSLAYRARARQLVQEGKQPPPFLVYLFHPNPKASSFKDNVAMPRLFRVLLGIVVLAGGALFVLGAAGMLATLDFSSMTRPVGAAFMLLLMLVLGLAFSYVGFRVMVVKNDEPLFGRTKR